MKTERDLPLFLYCLLKQFENIEKDYLQMLELYDKLEESANIIRKWIDDRFLNSNYDYCLTETDTKIMLSIIFRNSVQLSIPINYAKYKQILPHIMVTVKAYEDLIASTKIKVFISEKHKK